MQLEGRQLLLGVVVPIGGLALLPGGARVEREAQGEEQREEDVKEAFAGHQALRSTGGETDRN